MGAAGRNRHRRFRTHAARPPRPGLRNASRPLGAYPGARAADADPGLARAARRVGHLRARSGGTAHLKPRPPAGARPPDLRATRSGRPPAPTAPRQVRGDDLRPHGCAQGVDRIAAALSTGAKGLKLQIVGSGPPEHAEQIRKDVSELRGAGVDVTRSQHTPYDDALRMVGSARCVILSFGMVPAASRVLLEAATMGTPVVAPDWGLVGHLVRSNGLGLVVDPADPRAIREAILRLCDDAALGASFEPDARLRRALRMGALQGVRSRRFGARRLRDGPRSAVRRARFRGASRGRDAGTRSCRRADPHRLRRARGRPGCRSAGSRSRGPQAGWSDPQGLGRSR